MATLKPVLRSVQPELLDTLPPGHPDARHNRRDLRLTNAIMGNFRWFRRRLARRLRPDDAIIELGAGEGDLGRALAGLAPRYAGLDRWPRPDCWRPHQGWHQTDLRTFSRYRDYTVLLANLILHQFTGDELRALGGKIEPSMRAILACEPARRRSSQWLYRTFGPLFGAHRVSLHDAHTSISAGFCGDELPRLLGLNEARWEVSCETTALGAYRMMALKRG